MNSILFEQYELDLPSFSHTVVLPRRDARVLHLIKVLHKTEGDYFDAGLLGGKRGQGRIEHIAADGSLCCSLCLEQEPLPRLPVQLAVGFPRPIQLRRLLRDMSSMGVEAIDLISTDLGEKSYRDTTIVTDGGARTALIEGAIQARDTVLPTLTIHHSIDAWLDHISLDRSLIAADNVLAVGSLLDPGCLTPPVVLAIGAERGWSSRERDLLDGVGFARLAMGDRALRTETACFAAVALVSARIGIRPYQQNKASGNA